LKEVLVFTLLRRYWSEMVSYDGGMSLLLMDGLLLVPLIMAAFFYPIQVLIGVGVALLVLFVMFECVVLWRKHHHTHVPHPRM